MRNVLLTIEQHLIEMEKQCQNARPVRHASYNVFFSVKLFLILTFRNAQH